MNQHLLRSVLLEFNLLHAMSQLDQKDLFKAATSEEFDSLLINAISVKRWY
jgi:hypothetical protein